MQRAYIAVLSFCSWYLNNAAHDGDFSRNAYTRDAAFKIQATCRLREFTSMSLPDGRGCVFACLEKQQAGECAAYQWDATTRTCHLQETLNITASLASADRVMVTLNHNDTGDCFDDTDCPPDHSCRPWIESQFDYPKNSCVATDCAAILAAGPCSNPSGVYTILAATPHPHEVWCDMDSDGGGWTVFLSRLDGSVDFDRDLVAYTQGFGNISGEYWLGLDTLHALTSSRTYELRADISDWEGGTVFSAHASMVVAGEAENYTLTLGAYTGGEGGDGFLVSNGMGFSAKHVDRDLSPRHNCALTHKGGFWYSNCLRVHPTGRYYVGGAYNSAFNDGMQWRSWRAHDNFWYSMKTITLKLRPAP